MPNFSSLRKTYQGKNAAADASAMPAMPRARSPRRAASSLRLFRPVVLEVLACVMSPSLPVHRRYGLPLACGIAQRRGEIRIGIRRGLFTRRLLQDLVDDRNLFDRHVEVRIGARAVAADKAQVAGLFVTVDERFQP